jgi:hypothetical protein
MLVAVSVWADTTNFWTNTTGGVFQNGANWNTGVAPSTPNDSAVWTNGSLSGTITFNAPVSNKIWSVRRGNIVFDIGAGRTDWLSGDYGLVVAATEPVLAQTTFASGTLAISNGSLFTAYTAWPAGSVNASGKNVLVVSGSHTVITNVGLLLSA